MGKKTTAAEPQPSSEIIDDRSQVIFGAVEEAARNAGCHDDDAFAVVQGAVDAYFDLINAAVKLAAGGDSKPD